MIYTWALVLAFFHTWAFTLQRSLGLAFFSHMGLYLYPASFWPSFTHGSLSSHLVALSWPFYKSALTLALLYLWALTWLCLAHGPLSSLLASFTYGPLPLLRPSLRNGPSPLIGKEKKVVQLFLLQGQYNKRFLNAVSSIPQRWSMMTYLV